MDTKKVIKYAYYMVYFLASILILLIVLAVVVLETTKNPDKAVREKAIKQLYSLEKKNTNLPDVWPPAMNKDYPDLALVDQQGTMFNLSEFKGKVVLVEYVDMTSPLSQAYSGAKSKGVLGDASQKFDENQKTIEEIILKETQGVVTLPHPDIVVVKVLIYNDKGGQAGPMDAERWAHHFGFTRENGVVVAVPQKDMREGRTDGLIPGFQLIDRVFDLRVDSAGPNPKHSLNFSLAPLIPTLLQAEVEQ